MQYNGDGTYKRPMEPDRAVRYFPNAQQKRWSWPSSTSSTRGARLHLVDSDVPSSFYVIFEMGCKHLNLAKYHGRKHDRGPVSCEILHDGTPSVAIKSRNLALLE